MCEDKLGGWDRCKCLICSVLQVVVNDYDARCSCTVLGRSGERRGRAAGQSEALAGIAIAPRSGFC